MTLQFALQGFKLGRGGELVLEQLDETNRLILLAWDPKPNRNGTTADLISAKVRNKTPETLTISGPGVSLDGDNTYTVPLGVGADGKKQISFSIGGSPGTLDLLLTTSDGLQEVAIIVSNGET